MSFDREQAIEAADDVMLAGLRATKGRRRIAAEVVDALAALPSVIDDAACARAERVWMLWTAPLENSRAENSHAFIRAVVPAALSPENPTTPEEEQ